LIIGTEGSMHKEIGAEDIGQLGLLQELEHVVVSIRPSWSGELVLANLDVAVVRQIPRQLQNFILLQL
jgi:hypothetical protein